MKRNSKAKKPFIAFDSTNIDLDGDVVVKCSRCLNPLKIVDAKQGKMEACECWITRRKDGTILWIDPQFKIEPKKK